MARRKLQQDFNRTNPANEFHEFSISAGRNSGGVNYYHHRRPRAEDHLSQSNLRIPPFLGNIDHDAYLEWEEEMELVFSCYHCTEAKKIKLATSGFSGHAIHWWDQIAFTRRHNGEPQITSWFEMKIVMKKRFSPDYNQFGYVQDSPRQGSRSERSKDVRSSQWRRPSSRPSPIQWIRQEHLCSKEKSDLQQPETNHSSPICKGKKENSNLKDFSNESFMCNYRKQIPRRLFVESVERNKDEKKEVSKLSSSPNEATVSRRLFGTEKFSNESITGKYFLPSFQIDYMPKGKEICRDLTICEPVSPSSCVFSPQDFKEDTLEEVPKKVPPASNLESSRDARDVFKTRGGVEKAEPLPNSFEGKVLVPGGEFNKDPFSVSSVSVLDKTCVGFTNLKPVQPSIREFTLQDHEDKLSEETPRRLSLDSNLASTTSWEFKPITHFFIGENRLKPCKDIGVPSSLPSMFVLVTPDEEKQFGLEDVKEVCVSRLFFDEMIQSFETHKSEMFSRPECSLIAETCDSKSVLSHKLIRRTLGQKSIGIGADLVIDECFSNKVLHNSNLVGKGCEILCCEDFWVLKPCDMNSALIENIFGSLSKLDHEFALLGLWFRNLSDLLRAKKRSEFEYVETASKLAQSNLFASNYISLSGLCSKEKLCSSECSNTRMIYDLILDGDFRNLNLMFEVLSLENSVDYFCCPLDVVLLVFAKKHDRQVMKFVPRTRRIQGLDKQVDYGPKEHLFVPSWQPPSTSQGEDIIDHTSNFSNLLFCVADELDLRSNPFKGGGDGVIQERPNKDAKKTGHEEDLDQMELGQDKENVGLRGLEGLVQPINGVWTKEKESLHKHGVKAHQSNWNTAQEDNQEETAQQKKLTRLFTPKAQEKETMDVELDQEEVLGVCNGPIISPKAQTQRKSLRQVIWAWLRRKRKKPTRLNQLGWFSCF